MYDLSLKFEPGRESILVSKIHIYPDWKSPDVSLDADIAMLDLERVVHFTDFIKPICLLKAEESPMMSGVVVGYGNNRDKIPHITEVPILTNEECFRSNQDLSKFSSPRTFCGGVGVCSCNAGSGLFVKINGVYHLRGILSSIPNEGSCDVNNYSIFTNVLKFKPWIKSKKTSEECGVMSTSTGLIQGGKFSTRKDFPWMASIVVKDGKFNVSGVLVSHKHVISNSLYVVTHDGDSQKFETVDIHRIKIYLAALKHDKSNFMFRPIKIVLNPYLKEIDGSAINNVNVITLYRTVQFNEFIRPICLWTSGYDLSLIYESPIYAVGYGVDETGKVSNIKKHVKMIFLQDDAACHEKFQEVTPNVIRETSTFCIESSGSGAPCEYDRYLFVKYNDRWYLRGAFQARFIHRNGTCSLDHPFLYEDLAKHTKWIQSQIEV